MLGELGHIYDFRGYLGAFHRVLVVSSHHVVYRRVKSLKAAVNLFDRVDDLLMFRDLGGALVFHFPRQIFRVVDFLLD